MQSAAVSIFVLIVGFILLIKGADFFVEGSSSVAKRLRVPSIIIGLTIVAMGTSLPECAVSVAASVSGSNTLAISNVVGSNIFNILFVLGIAGTISPMGFIANNIIDTAILIFVSLLTLLLAWRKKKIGRFEGAVMIAVYTTYMCYICMR